MAVTQFNYVKGNYETLTDEDIGSFTLDTYQHVIFEDDGYYKFLFADPVLKVKSSGATVPTTSYEKLEDSRYTTREAESGGSGKTIYAQIKITDVSYAGIDLTFSGSNFGTYTDNEATKDRIDAIFGYQQLSTDTTVTILSVQKNTVIDCQAGISTLTLSPATGVTEANKIQVFNNSGSSITVTEGTNNYTLGDGQIVTYYFVGTALKTGTTPEATAWVNFDGAGTVSIRDSFNVSSITDNGTGDYTINFATAMDNTDYVVIITCGQTGSSNSLVSPTLNTLSTNSCRFGVTYVNGSQIDADNISVAIFGGKD